MTEAYEYKVAANRDQSKPKNDQSRHLGIRDLDHRSAASPHSIRRVSSQYFSVRRRGR